jgi:N-methylhydantoinase A
MTATGTGPDRPVQSRRIRVAVDIGGTFTDLECLDEDTGAILSHKVPTTPEDPSIGQLDAITSAASRHGFTLDDITLLICGTTIATNAVLTRDLPVAALITTAGFEDVLEIGRHARRDVYWASALRNARCSPHVTFASASGSASASTAPL